MENGRKEFLSVLCNLYMIALMAAVPLYTGGTYYLIGDTKYRLFRNVSLICLGLWLLLGVVPALWEGIRRILDGRKSQKALKGEKGNWGTGHIKKNYVDNFMIFYGVCVLLSAVCSPYKGTPWTGYRDWYMGAVSQLIFVGIYFFVSRNYDGSAYPIYLGEAALFLAALVGIINRLGKDPLRLLAPFLRHTWESVHMLSTIGNINWLCGYMGVMTAFPLSGYLNGGKKGKNFLMLVLSGLSIVLLILQGSDIGVIMAGCCLGSCFVAGFLPRFKSHRLIFFEKGILLTALVSALLSGVGWRTVIRRTEWAVPGDGPTRKILFHPAVFTVLFLILLLVFLAGRKIPESVRKTAAVVIPILGCLTVCVCAVWYFAKQGSGIAWGSGRGSLWKAALKGFGQAGPLQKLLGAGPDCFAEYIYSIMPAEEVFGLGGYWGKSIFANAHNEWLNSLVNLGVLGTLAYLGIFVSAAGRYRGMLLGLLALAMYGLNTMVCFQQVLNTPLLFLVLGLCENRIRRWEEQQGTQREE